MCDSVLIQNKISKHTVHFCKACDLQETASQNPLPPLHSYECSTFTPLWQVSQVLFRSYLFQVKLMGQSSPAFNSSWHMYGIYRGQNSLLLPGSAGEITQVSSYYCKRHWHWHPARCSIKTLLWKSDKWRTSSQIQKDLVQKWTKLVTENTKKKNLINENNKTKTSS